ncbi:MAG: potassium transporter TrkG [Bacteroidales bacterium]|jgi:trk system potassium uptake protein TrkH|nr:TrkH family potassium uptake protein [Bacteroidales bacterium]MDD3702229.1 potassium transporter TrkG [Bacteroidales bacterium]MDY0368896.1 potassium transporter TrkG [Bacteroidales bacterium]
MTAAHTKLINFPMIIRVIGFLLIIEGVFMLTVVPVEWYFEGYSHNLMLISAAITLVIGSLFFFSTAKINKTLSKREGYIIVSFAWVITSLFGALPYLLQEDIPSFTDAFFETMSGFTTTGATILTDIESMPKALLFWRSLTHWIGGMGIIMLSVAILPILGIGGFQLFMAEVPGVTYDKIHPRITSTSKNLWAIYVLFTFIQFVLLWAGEMNWFDAVNHSFSTMSTGGFSTRNNSVAAYGIYSQYIIIAFMIIAGTNFTLHYFALHGQLRKAIKNEEFRGYLGIIFVLSLFFTFILVLSDQRIEQAFRESIFTVVSVLTTTGFVTVDYLSWPVLMWVLVFLLMFIGGSAGSTSGGMKVIRQMLLIKNAWMELKRAIHPNAVLPVKFNGKSVSRDIIFKVMAFFLMYIMLFVVGMLLLVVIGLDFETAIGASIASIGNIGPAIGQLGPTANYALLPDIAKWVLSFLMMLGRLELFTVMILFSPHFWRQ